MAALAAIFAGCSNNDDEVTQPKVSLKDTPINVNVLMTTTVSTCRCSARWRVS